MIVKLNHNNYMIIPAPLKIGDTIGVMSPSSFIEESDLSAAVKIVEARGYKVHVHPQTLAKHNQSAGTNEQKLNAFHDLIKNPDINAIIFSTGGNRAMHWVDEIELNLIKNNPKIIMGFSDLTSLINVINKKTGLITFHGPNLRWFMVHENNAADTEQCFDVLSNPTQPHYFSKEMNGELVGGNGSIFQYLINDVELENKILFLEDWNIETSHLDLLFCHLNRQKVFEKINGLILGKFDNLTDTGRPYGFTFDDTIAEHVPSNLPIIHDAPFGHGDRLITLPIGRLKG